MEERECDLMGTIFLNENVRWNQYYRQLEEELDPLPFQSMYYIIKKH
jgi:hypothetical protein